MEQITLIKANYKSYEDVIIAVDRTSQSFDPTGELSTTIYFSIYKNAEDYWNQNPIEYQNAYHYNEKAGFETINQNVMSFFNPNPIENQKLQILEGFLNIILTNPLIKNATRILIQKN